MRRLFISLVFLLVSITANAADYCVGASATGTGSGTDWNNQAAWSSITFARGNTYYLADGNYGCRTFSTAVSGSTYIYIKKATSSAHGTATGWSSAYGDGQAIFNDCGMTFTTSYWDFDGVVGEEDGSSVAHGFKMYDDATSAIVNRNFFNIVTTGVSYIRIAHTEASRPDRTYYAQGVDATTGTQSYLTFEYNYFHDMFGVFYYFISDNNIIIDHCWHERNKSTTEKHAEGIQARVVDYLTVRCSHWEDIEGTYTIGCANVTSGTTQPSLHWKIYGNTFFRNTFGFGHGESSIGTNYCSTGDWLIYNNTWYEKTLRTSGYSGADLSPYATGYSGTNYMSNNLFINARAVNNNSVSQSYNTYWWELVPTVKYIGSTNYTTSNNNEVTTASLPLVSNSDLHLSASGVATLLGGTSISPSGTYLYNIDAEGLTRGLDGEWDRGAYEYDSGGSDAYPTTSITVPTSSATYNTTNSSEAVSGTASDDNTLPASSVTWACSTCTPTSGTATGTTSWSIASIGLAVGVNSIVVTVTDSAAQATTDTIAIYSSSGSDTTAPTVSNVSPSGTITYQTTVSFECDATDAGSPPVACRCDDSQALYEHMLVQMTKSSDHFSVSSPTLTPNTTYSWWIRCIDAAGNQTATNAIAFTTGPELPTFGNIAVEGGGTNSISLSGGSLSIEILQ